MNSGKLLRPADQPENIVKAGQIRLDLLLFFQIGCDIKTHHYAHTTQSKRRTDKSCCDRKKKQQINQQMLAVFTLSQHVQKVHIVIQGIFPGSSDFEKNLLHPDSRFLVLFQKFQQFLPLLQLFFLK